mmetsp:Transcript_18790/g.28139  ORF Transcript_18790/g.28139 Transcript_18790/m.28139 type:complete len:139 (-) Transcript_18790:9-425(-)|eukprot:CAMPEP_0203667306 /NCGR_PEP_ID=MMETSP0090-20130426/4167_1 /ASSEMBLY_ACC=CAM_ASM_001088 /TAXON_ID=426623 /ORGANISM="Chaetoceros affinis, Strain CCMP159" /LENGTH=138 /DNA_ID=CAMNT_0050531425 /DNA_START=46 /DNA_END=462 /DNA_ORIENTATION=-
MGAQDEILKLNQELLDSIASGNFSKYNSLCASDLTCFEPETAGVLVQGISFHKYYFDLDQAMAKETETESASASTLPITNISMSNPHLRWLGDDAVIIAYTRLDQKLDVATPVTKKTSETRVWEKRDGEWKHVHFHKS